MKLFQIVWVCSGIGAVILGFIGCYHWQVARWAMWSIARAQLCNAMLWISVSRSAARTTKVIAGLREDYAVLLDRYQGFVRQETERFLEDRT